MYGGVCVFSSSTFPDWFHHKILLSSHPLKLWSHRYVCSIVCRAWHWIIHLLLLFLLHSPCSHSSFHAASPPSYPPNFLSILIFSLFVSPFFKLWCSLCRLYFFSTSFAPPLTILLFLNPPPHIHSLHLQSLQYCQPWGKSQPSLLFIY